MKATLSREEFKAFAVAVPMVIHRAFMPGQGGRRPLDPTTCDPVGTRELCAQYDRVFAEKFYAYLKAGEELIEYAESRVEGKHF